MEAALSPKVYALLWKKYEENGIPPDSVIRHHLILDLEFNPKAVDAFIRGFRSSLGFAGLIQNGVSSESTNAEPDGGEVPESSNLFADLPPTRPPSKTEDAPMPETRQQYVRTIDIPFLLSGGLAFKLLLLQNCLK